MFLRFHAHRLGNEISNFALLRHRRCDGMTVSMHQSGTHWLKHQLGVAIALQYGLPPPQFMDANDIIGGFKDSPPPSHVPHIISSHSIPHVLVGSRLLRYFLHFPRYVVLIRDIRSCLVSNYEKWKDTYGCSFSEFLHVGIGERRFNSDFWWCLRFFNAWGRIAQRFPSRTLVVRYEDMNSEPHLVIARISDFLNLDLNEEQINIATRMSTKTHMKTKESGADGLAVIREDTRPPSDWFTEKDRILFSERCTKLLRHDFGYDYNLWH